MQKLLLARINLLLFLPLFFQGCISFSNPFNKIPPGQWRAVLQIEPRPTTNNPKGEPLPELMDLTFEEVNQGELPFLFEVIYVNEDSFYIEIINGEERIPVHHIAMGRDPETAWDTIKIDFPVYDSHIIADYSENVIQGYWVVRSKENYQIPFIAKHGKDHRFTTLVKEPLIDLTGKWAVQFGVETENPYPAIGEFIQNGNQLSGTFLTETGDYRYLDGTIQGDKLYLSCFDGAHAFLFEAKINPDHSLIGSFRSGAHYKTIWTAQKDAKVSLPSPDSLTTAQNGGEAISFTFPDASGNMVSLDDPAFEGKPKLIYILGTWCPNCRDETEFLVNYLQSTNQDFVVLGIAFERYKEKTKALKAIQTYQEKMQTPYKILWGGYSNKKQAAENLPFLSAVIAYPTMIFLNEKNQIKRIHTGFSGPATSEFERFTKEFPRYLEEIGIP